MERAGNKANWLLAAMLLLAGAAWLDHRAVPTVSRDAHAQDSIKANPAEDRQTLISELGKINAKLDRLIALFESGKIKVVITNAEELREPAPGGRSPAAAPADGEDRDVPEPKIIIKRRD